MREFKDWTRWDFIIHILFGECDYETPGDEKEEDMWNEYFPPISLEEYLKLNPSIKAEMLYKK